MDQYTLGMISFLLLGCSFSLFLITAISAFNDSLSIETRFKNLILTLINGVSSISVIFFMSNNNFNSIPEILQFILVVVLSAITVGTLVEQVKNYFYGK